MGERTTLPVSALKVMKEKRFSRPVLRPFPSDLLTMWPISTKVNYPRNDTPDIINRIEVSPTDLSSME